MTTSRDFNHLAPPHTDDPYPVFAALRREAPVVYNPIFNLWFVTRHDDVVEVLRDASRFSSAHVLDPVEPPDAEIREALGDEHTCVYPLLSSDPPLHTRVRGFVAKAFSSARTAALEPRITAIADALIDTFAADGCADLIARFAHPLPMRLTGEMFGIPPADMPEIKRWCDEETLFLMAPLPHAQRLAFARSVAAYRAYLRAMVEDHRRSPRGDLVDELISAQVDDASALTTEEIAGALCVLIFAAHETTTNMLGNTLLHLLRRPEQWRALCADPARIPAALEEGLRYDPPVQGMTRTVTAATELGGVALPAGARVFVVFASANRDPACASDPDRFDPARAPAQHLSFGRGPHFCVGAALARLEGRIAIERLARRLPNLRLAGDGPLPYSPNLVHRGPTALEIAWDPA
ncbi:MAG: cytochrome P450 [Minicystis sp.]